MNESLFLCKAHEKIEQRANVFSKVEMEKIVDCWGQDFIITNVKTLSYFYKFGGTPPGIFWVFFCKNHKFYLY